MGPGPPPPPPPPNLLFPLTLAFWPPSGHGGRDSGAHFRLTEMAVCVSHASTVLDNPSTHRLLSAKIFAKFCTILNRNINMCNITMTNHQKGRSTGYPVVCHVSMVLPEEPHKQSACIKLVVIHTHLVPDLIPVSPINFAGGATIVWALGSWLGLPEARK